MDQGWSVSLSALGISCVIGFLLWALIFSVKRRRRRREEEIKRRIEELTGENYDEVRPTVEDLERMYDKKG